MGVLVVDDDVLVLESVRRRVQAALDEAGADVAVHVATDLALGLEQIRALAPLLGGVFDLRLGGTALDGLGLIDAARAKDPDVPIAVLTGALPAEILDCAASRLVFVVQKGSGNERAVLAAFMQSVLRRAQTPRFADTLARVAAERGLTGRETSLLGAYVQGSSDKELAQVLSIGQGTLNGYKARITRKLATDSMRKAAFQVLRRAYRDL
jgi:DNA-binding NarL/FixJ family response regulator